MNKFSKEIFEQPQKLAENITRFGGKVALITKSLTGFNNPDIYVIQVPCQDEYLFPIPAIIPLQFIVNRWAVDKGQEPIIKMGAKVTPTE
jgi:glutamine---fructose-6-phosphate transaminase (isomerizing)